MDLLFLKDSQDKPFSYISFYCNYFLLNLVLHAASPPPPKLAQFLKKEKKEKNRK
jgi:hypothetical protein